MWNRTDFKIVFSSGNDVTNRFSESEFVLLGIFRHRKPVIWHFPVQIAKTVRYIITSQTGNDAAIRKYDQVFVYRHSIVSLSLFLTVFWIIEQNIFDNWENQTENEVIFWYVNLHAVSLVAYAGNAAGVRRRTEITSPTNFSTPNYWLQSVPICEHFRAICNLGGVVDAWNGRGYAKSAARGRPR